MALDLLRWQAEVNPIYGAFLSSAHKNARELNHWTEFPALPVEAFKRNKVTCFDYAQAVLRFETSGTTGAQTGCHYLKSSACYERALELGFRASLPDLSSHRWLSLIPTATERPHSSLSYMIGHLGKMFLKSSGLEYVVDENYVLDMHRIEHVLREAEVSGQKMALFGTSFALAQLSEKLMQAKKRFWLNSESVIFDTGGYKGRHRELSAVELIDLLQRALGIELHHIWNEYGMTELSSQGYARLEEGLHRFPAWLKVRVMDPSTGTEAQLGEKGLLHFYDLANVHSVMAVGTQDIGIREADGVRLLGRLKNTDERGCSLSFEL